jgi:uncharacterized protein YcbX
METTTSGIVTALWRYPVKSMLGERCPSLTLNARGVDGDRLYAVVDANGKLGSGKSTRRFARIDGLFRFRSVYDGDVPVIAFPDGRRLRGDDAGIHDALTAALGQPVTLAREAAVSHFDSAPVHLLTTASLAWLAATTPGSRLDERRFRPNILVQVAGATAIEREWLGRRLRLGAEVELAGRRMTGRCVMVTLPQSELPEDAQILRSIAQEADDDFGIYLDVITPGRIRVGDEVAVI